jgi:pyruvate,orthophosphate dikinase
MAKATKHVYLFGNGKAEGRGDQRELLGGKGAGLAEMTSIGLPVPAGFTITTACCAQYHTSGNKWPKGLEDQIKKQLRALENICKKKLGHPKNPLLVSVRSGAAASMPGMMETILNLGLNDESVEGLAKISDNRRFALDAYRRLIMMYGSTAMGVPREEFEKAFGQLKESKTRTRLGKGPGEKVIDTDANDDELDELIQSFKTIYQKHTGHPFPQDPYQQLVGAVNAVFSSWNAEKAVTYRRVEKLDHLIGTAVNVQQMVFGNTGDDSGTGVCFTRDPSTGENVFYGDLLINAQGEDVVAGIRTPVRLIELQKLMPKAYEQLEAVRVMLEAHYKEMQDLEFTIEHEKLYMLQCRTGKRSPQATFKIAVDHATKPLASLKDVNALVKKRFLPKRYAKLAGKPVITKDQAIARVKPVDIERLFYPVIDPAVSKDQLNQCRMGAGISAVPGAASGKVAFSAKAAEEMAADGQRVILVRKETSPEDVGGMHAANGILTATGGKTSHAAVVARGWGKCCIVGCEALNIDYHAQQLTLNGKTVKAGEYLSLDGSEGIIYQGELPLTPPRASKEFEVLLGWCDERRRLKVRTNADTPADAAKAIDMGAEGIGLCRTEHMFFETQERRLAIQEMIVADTEQHRRHALDKLLPFQRKDFIGIFEAMAGKPVTIRLIDPPLHEFLPKTDADRQKLSDVTGVPVADIERRSELLHEFNPMLGHRGCRLCITYPEILEMQVTAIIEAAVDCIRRGVKVLPEIMIPLSIDPKELRILVDKTHAVAKGIIQQAGAKIDYLVGTMIETPRAALLADQLAEVAQFFSFGTNDLTQMTMGLSRDDAGGFLPEYVDQQKAAIFKEDPFISLDQEGVGMLVRSGIERGRQTNPKIKIGICGEHGGELDSVKFCHRAGMEYVSCSPYRVPIARLAAAQAVIEDADAPKRKPAKRPAKSTPKRTAKKTAKRKTAKKTPAKKAKNTKKKKNRR